MTLPHLDDLTSRLPRYVRRPQDSELEQIGLRVMIVFIAVAYVACLALFGPGVTSEIQAVGAALLINLLLAGAIALWRKASPDTSPARRIVGIVLDNAAIGAVMALGGQYTAWFVGFFIFVNLGHGLRFGREYLALSTTLSVLAFGTVMAVSPFWREHLYLGLGFLVFVILIPVYQARLLALVRAKNEQAARADASKSRFLTHMSREIRTPLHAIVGASDLLKEAPSADDRSQCVDVIGTASQQLLTVVQEMLDVTSIEAGQLIREDTNFDVRSVMNGMLDVVESLALGHKLKLDIRVDDAIPMVVRADATHLRQVLINLAMNAIRYSRSGVVTIRANALDMGERHCRLRFSVSDTGLSVPENQRGIVFEQFGREEPPNDESTGSGLGLYVAKALVTVMDGTIGYRPNAPAGSTFFFEIPVEVVAAPARQLRAVEDPKVVTTIDPYLRHRHQVKPLHVLLVEDMASNRLVVEQMLKRAGHSVTAVENGEQALVAIEDHKPDLVILDLHLPDMHGHEVLKISRFLRMGDDRVPVIVITADATETNSQLSKRAGAVAFVAKPVAADRLLEQVALATQSGATTQSVGNEIVNVATLREALQTFASQDAAHQVITDAFLDLDRGFHQLRDAVGMKNMSLAVDQLIAIKGVAASLGFVQIAEQCTRLMAHRSKISPEDWTQQCKGLKPIIERARLEIDRLQRNGFFSRSSSSA